MGFPETIHFLSDDNKASIVPNSIEDGKATYIYTKSKTKKGMEFSASQEYLSGLTGCGLLKTTGDLVAPILPSRKITSVKKRK